MPGCDMTSSPTGGDGASSLDLPVPPDWARSPPMNPLGGYSDCAPAPLPASLPDCAASVRNVDGSPSAAADAGTARHDETTTVATTRRVRMNVMREGPLIGGWWLRALPGAVMRCSRSPVRRTCRARRIGVAAAARGPADAGTPGTPVADAPHGPRCGRWSERAGSR